MKLNNKKILLVRPDGIGDFVIFSAILEEYGKLYSEYKIDLLCQSKVRELVQSIPFINNIICINTQKLFRKRHLIYTGLSIFKAAKLKYEKVVYPAYSRTRNDDLMVNFIKAKEKIAFDGNSSNDPNNERFKRNKYFTRIIEGEEREKLEMERNVEFINSLGADIDVAMVRPKIWFSDRDNIEFQCLREKYNFEKNDYITIFPGAGYSGRYWENKKWAELIKRIIGKYPQSKIVILGYGEDIFPINGILKALDSCCNRELINLYSQTTLRILAKVIQNSKLFIGTESGAVHIAVAVGIPNVCLIGGGHFGRFYPYGDLSKNRAVYKKMDCFGCNWRCKYKVPKCIGQISVDNVWREVELLI